MRIHFEELGELVWKELSKTTFSISREVKSTETNNVNKITQSGKEYGRAGRSNRDVVPIGYDIEPIGESRADVYMGNDEDEELLEAEIPSVRMNPTSREKQEHEISGQIVHKNRCAALCRRVLVDNIELNWRKKKEKSHYDCSLLLRLLDTRKRRHVTHSDLSRQQVWSNGSNVL